MGGGIALYANWLDVFTYSDDAKTVITGLTSNASNLTEIVIPKSVTTIYGTSSSDGAFRNNKILQKVTFEDGSQCTSIGSFAFYDCSSLTSITIPASVTSIGNYAFNGCSNLSTATFEDVNRWYGYSDSTFTNGIKLTLTDAAQNATYLKSTYYNYYWKKSTT